MANTDILTYKVLVESKKTATIHAPVERVDIADWLLHLGARVVAKYLPTWVSLSSGPSTST